MDNNTPLFTTRPEGEDVAICFKGESVFTHPSADEALDHISDLELCYSYKNWVTVENDAQTVWREALIIYRNTRRVEGLNGDVFLIDTDTDKVVCKQVWDNGELISYQPLAEPATTPKVHQRQWGESARMLLGLLRLNQGDFFNLIDQKLIKNANDVLAERKSSVDMLRLEIPLTQLDKATLEEVVRVGDLLDSDDPADVLEGGSSQLVQEHALTVFPVVGAKLTETKSLLDLQIHQGIAEELYSHLDVVVVAGTLGSQINLLLEQVSGEEE